MTATGSGNVALRTRDPTEVRPKSAINELSAGLTITDLAAAARVLRELSDRLETSQQPRRRRKDRQ